MRAPPQVIIYTDGACSGNPGPGGYGVVLISGKHRKELSGGFRLTTNNRMELMAAIEGLKALKVRAKVALYSDSQYLVNAMNTGTVHRWRAKTWMHGGQSPVPNADLWRELLALCRQHRVEFMWTRGHAGDKENERCDELARQAMRGKLDVDTYYEQSQQPEPGLFQVG